MSDSRALIAMGTHFVQKDWMRPSAADTKFPSGDWFGKICNLVAGLRGLHGGSFTLEKETRACASLAGEAPGDCSDKHMTFDGTETLESHQGRGSMFNFLHSSVRLIKPEKNIRADWSAPNTFREPSLPYILQGSLRPLEFYNSLQ